MQLTTPINSTELLQNGDHKFRCEHVSSVRKRKRRPKAADLDARYNAYALWEDNLASLRGGKRNAAIFARITESLNSAVASAGVEPVELFTAKQVKLKIENLGQINRSPSLVRRPRASACILGRLGSNPPTRWCQMCDPLFLPFDMAAKDAPVPALAAASLRSPVSSSFDDAGEWLPWLQQFEDYSFATGMHVAPDGTRVRTLLYCMGPRACILHSVAAVARNRRYVEVHVNGHPLVQQLKRPLELLRRAREKMTCRPKRLGCPMVVVLPLSLPNTASNTKVHSAHAYVPSTMASVFSFSVLALWVARA
ncbi:hypothetical protein HPB47_005376 [Ixodes persulcatus]|uniref:Uncharacterized protein n=1 Tax=Ixodes persulcatus TaxID=34615 RepID=A0AC60PE09_IXOPE|nr:hypothetical protein HPB47_005376 [Ixodes persulcatus]